MNKLDELKAISQHHLKNAWWACRFGTKDDFGIHGSCPSELLHFVQLGIFKYCRDIFFETLGDDANVSYEINGLAKTYGYLLAHQSERDFPTTNFSKGIKEGKLMARDYRGALLVMDAVILSSAGQALLSTKRKFRNDTGKIDWVLLVETLLEWEHFLGQPTMKKKHVKRLQRKHRCIMHIMKKVAQRKKGMGLNLMKFHAILHLMDDILNFGVPSEHNTAFNESHHKLAKYAAMLTQRNEHNFEQQVAIRQWEFLVLAMALEEIYHRVKPSDYYLHYEESMSESSRSMDASSQSNTSGARVESDIVTDGARIVVERDESGSTSFEFQSKGEHAERTALPTELLDFLVELQETASDYLPSGKLEIRTRHRREGIIFHAHPNFMGKGPWKDWAVVDWGRDYGKLPCHIQAFVVLDGIPNGSGLEFGGMPLRNGTYGVVEEAKLDIVEGFKSDLLTPYLKTVGKIVDKQATERKFFLADTEAIVSPCSMIPDIGGPPNPHFYVKPRREWAKEFVLWVEAPHSLDEMSDDEADED